MHPLYLQDFYLKEFNATVMEADGKLVTLDNTAFYPGGGGQPCDTGTIRKGNETFSVFSVRKESGQIVHELDRELSSGDKVHCNIDWQRRYALMRMHTAAHVFSAIIHGDTGVLVTGNQLGAEESRMDFALERFEREKIGEWARKANEAMAKSMEVRHYFLPREEALKMEGMVKLANALPPNVTELHVVEIGGIDREADGGTHVANTREIGTLEVTRIESKGKNNRRIYFKIPLL